MSTEQIFKLQPDRTMYLRGFTGVGAAASLYNAKPDGLNVSGVFRDMADFAVLVLYDADNTFEHYTLRSLPDFDLSGLVLNFDLSYQGLQPIDSAKYSWIDWAEMDVIRQDESTAKIRLWDHATLASNNYSVAQGAYHISAPGGCTKYDRLTLFVNNASFDFIANGGESAADVAKAFAYILNNYNWSTFESNSISVIASAGADGTLSLNNARTGQVTISGHTVTWVEGIKFPGIAPGSPIYLGGAAATVVSVDSPTSLTVDSPPDGTDGKTLVYLAEYGGADGNSVTTYMVVRPGNVALAVDQPVLQLAGGNSDNVLWNVSIDFTQLAIDKVRQAWLTFAPQLANGKTYKDTEWTAAFSNWSVQDPNGVRLLRCAGPSSTRVGNSDTLCTYLGSGWSTTPANNYWHGYGRKTATAGDAFTVTYTCQSTHDLYLGTSLYPGNGTVRVTLDGDTATDLNCALGVTSELVTRRLLRSAVPAGTHSVTVTLQNAAPFLFDFLEAAVPDDLPAPMVTYSNVSPALDFDTDATYKVSPQRLLWHLSVLGFAGHINEYLGVFWWNQRHRVGGVWNTATITFGGTWRGDTDKASIILGDPNTPGAFFQMLKSVTTWDTPDTIAQHFVYYINSASVSMWAEKTGTGQLTIHTRTPNWGDPVSAAATSAAGTVWVSGNLNVGVDGTWQIDPSIANPVNFPVRLWHSDLYRTAQALGVPVTTSVSMELVNPPDAGVPGNQATIENTWQARYADGTAVATDAGVAKLFSSQCAPVPNFTEYQKKVFATLAGLQSDAGLTPWLQFGEFLWWFYSSMSQEVGYCANMDPISIGVASPHGMTTGDRVVISGVQGCTAANGTWPVTVTDATHFTIPVSGNGDWVSNTGQVRGGSMAYYDPVTMAQAQAALGRPLYNFTCQDDDPSVNNGADAAFLAAQLKGHVDAIQTAVLADYPNTKFEILYPNDVNNPVCYVGPYVHYPQGGRLNAAVNRPAAWNTKATSGFDRFKVEALSWGATYCNLDLAHQAIEMALTAPLSWDLADVAYLIPWFNGACPWPAELNFASARGIAVINLWAYDHLVLMSWPLPFPTPIRRSFYAG